MYSGRLVSGRSAWIEICLMQRVVGSVRGMGMELPPFALSSMVTFIIA